MADYCGDPENIKIQKRIRARQGWIANTPSVANGGRVLNIVDPEDFGWENTRVIFGEDRLLAFVAQDQETFLPKIQAELGAECDYPIWQVYRGSSNDVNCACTELLNQINLPDGWRIETLLHPDADQISQVQELNLATGVAPYPEYYSEGSIIGCATTVLWSDTGKAVGSASVAEKFHPDGLLAGTVFKGSTCVLPEHRGRSLGKLVNAHNLIASIMAFDWIDVLSQVQPNNVASQNTIGTCGLFPIHGSVTVGVLPKGVIFTR